MSTYCLTEKMEGLHALGINLSVYSEKGLLVPREDGFLVQEDYETRFSVVLEMPVRSDVAVVLASSGKEKKLNRMTNIASNNIYMAMRNISTHMTGFGSTTKPPDNSFKVISTGNGILRVFEIGIATRTYLDVKGCHHFLTVQEVYTGQLYFDEATQKVMVPAEEFAGYQNWPSLRELVAEMTDKDSLPRSVTPVSRELPPVTGSNRGRVIFFNASTGLGLVKIADNKVAGLHWTKINLDVPFPYVETGEEVVFGTSYTEKGFTKIADVKPA